MPGANLKPLQLANVDFNSLTANCYSRENVSLRQQKMDEAYNLQILSGVLLQKGQENFFTSHAFIRVLQQTLDPKYRLRKNREEGI